MNNPPAGLKTAKRRLSKELRMSAGFLRARICNAMAKWRRMNEPADILGRGLGRAELIERVAAEVGVSPREVRSAMKAHRAPKS